MSDYEHLIRGADAHSPKASEPPESQFLRSSGEMDPYQGDGDEYMTARSQSFEDPSQQYHQDRSPAAVGDDAFDIAEFRRMHGLPAPPPRTFPVRQMNAPATSAADNDTSSSDDDMSMDDDTSSLNTPSLSTRSSSSGNPDSGLLAHTFPYGSSGASGGAPRPKKRGFFKKLWSAVRGRGWR